VSALLRGFELGAKLGALLGLGAPQPAAGHVCEVPPGATAIIEASVSLYQAVAEAVACGEELPQAVLQAAVDWRGVVGEHAELT
jgi:hypothetical protein